MRRGNLWICLGLLWIVGCAVEGDDSDGQQNNPTDMEDLGQEQDQHNDTDGEVDPPQRALVAGTYGCVMQREITFNEERTSTPPSISVEVMLDQREQQWIMTSTETLLGLCPLAWQEGEEGLEAPQCDGEQASPWTEGQLLTTDNGFEANLFNDEEAAPGQRVQVSIHLDCTPRQAQNHRRLDLSVKRSSIRVSFGPEPGLVEQTDTCLRECSYDIPQGWFVELTSNNNRQGPPTLTFTPDDSEGCNVDSDNNLHCAFTLEEDRALDVEWPYVENLRTLHVNSPGARSDFSFSSYDNATLQSCNEECTLEVDAGSDVSVTVHSVDVDIDISGTRYMCAISNRTWYCSFNIEEGRTFTVLGR